MQGDNKIIELLNEQLYGRADRDQPVFPARQDAGELGIYQAGRSTPAKSRSTRCATPRGSPIASFSSKACRTIQELGILHIGQTVKEQLRADLDVELEVVTRLRPAIILMREKGDHTSARLFEEILEDEERHIDYLETELGLIGSLGEQLYLARYAEPPSAS